MMTDTEKVVANDGNESVGSLPLGMPVLPVQVSDIIKPITGWLHIIAA